MAKTQYLEYTINLTDKDLVEDLQAAFPVGVLMAPNAAALTHLAPIQLVTDPHVNPGTRSPHFILTNPGNYDRSVSQFSRKSGGWFGLSFLFGTTTLFKWVGKYVFAGNSTSEIDGVPTEVVAIAKRKFMVGFESSDAAATGMEIASGGSGQSKVMREASRHADGMGWFSSGNVQLTAAPTQSGDAGVNKAWERFYFRPITAPNVTTRMHRLSITAGGGNAGCSLNMTVDRRLVLHNITNAGVETALATSSMQFELGTWYRVDVLLEIKTPGGNVRVFINREEIIDVVAPAGTGFSQAQTHETSFLGPGALGGATNEFQCHYDDWICAEWPTEDSGGRYVGIDWLNGSRVRAIPATGLAAGNNWTGDYRYANQFVAPANIDASAVLASSVSGDALRLTVDAGKITAEPGSLGVVAFLVAWNGVQTVAGNGTLGWKFDGVIDLASHVEGTVAGWTRRWHRPSGATEGIANLTPFELHKVKAANANPASCGAFTLIVEMVGVFGPEDVPADEAAQPAPMPSRRGIHNAPYPTTMWARSSLPTISPVIIHSGTYTGNGTAQELFFRCPVGWLMIKRIPSTRTGSFWFSSMITGHPVGEFTPAGGWPVQAMIDPSFVSGGAEDDQEQRTVIRITGNNAAWNENTVAYEFVAFMDPGSRYHLNGAYQVPTAAFVTKDVSFPHSTFLPEYGFYHPEQGTFPAAAATYTRAIKGPGHAADAGSVMNIAETAVAIRHAAGLLTVLAGFETQQDTSAAFSLWRDDDQSSDPNKHHVVKIGTYTGDGAASRTINFGTSGKRPLYAIVSPHNATPSHHRDPSNLTNTSNTMGVGGETTTGITAGGIDSFTVGVTLNTAAVVYEYFVLIGSATAGNGGWSIDGEFSVVEPDSPEDGDYDDPLGASEPVEPDPDPDPDPGTSDEDDCEAGDVCVAATTREVNRALLEIGNTKFLTNYCTQQTLEARTARLLYESSVRSVLHAMPWPFATKYAVLALAGTQPTHEDWDFAYRQPIDCVFERRIVVDRGTGVDPKGPGFELSADASGGLILTNEANAVLEYTCRPPCVAFVGDALFKEALKWHLAEAFASPLTRMPEKGPYCRIQYEAAITKANAIIKPGQPGLRDAAPVIDTAAACVAANVRVANVALVRIGANTIANLATEQSREAVAANLIFEHELRATLRDYPWKFAKRYNTAALTLVGGTASSPVNHDWQYSYRLPTDYVAARRLPTTGTGRSFERYPNTFEVGSDATGYLLFTGLDTANVNLEYTARIECCVARADDLFRDAMAWRLAYTLAASLAQVDPTTEEARGRGPAHPPDPTQRISHKPNEAAMRERMQRWAFGQYLRAIEKARVADANESEPEPHGEAEWIEGRN